MRNVKSKRVTYLAKVIIALAIVFLLGIITGWQWSEHVIETDNREHIYKLEKDQCIEVEGTIVSLHQGNDEKTKEVYLKILIEEKDGLSYVYADERTYCLWNDREINLDFLREGDSLVLYFSKDVLCLETNPCQYSEHALQIEFVKE